MGFFSASAPPPVTVKPRKKSLDRASAAACRSPLQPVSAKVDGNAPAAVSDAAQRHALEADCCSPKGGDETSGASLRAAPQSAAPAGAELEVWLPHNEKVWVRGRVMRQEGRRTELMVQTEDGASVKVDVAKQGELLAVNPNLEADMTSLWHLHEPGVLANLEGRFRRDEPYTCASSLAQYRY